MTIKQFTISETRHMKTKRVLAFVAIASIGIVLTVWKSFSAPPATRPPSAHAALAQPTKARLESPSNDSFPNAPAQPQAQTRAEAITQDLLIKIQTALASTNLDDHENVYTNLLAELVRIDPLEAAWFAETNSIGHTRDQVLERIAQLWAATDPAAALSWATTLNNPTEREAILTEVCLQMAESDPAEAVRIRSQFVIDGSPNRGLEALAERWAEKDFPAALDWALSRAASEQRDLLIARMAYVQSQTSPIEAASLVVETIPTGKVLTEAAIAVLHQWALNDLSAAGQWAARFPEGELRSRAYSELGSIARIKSAGQPR